MLVGLLIFLPSFFLLFLSVTEKLKWLALNLQKKQIYQNVMKIYIKGYKSVVSMLNLWKLIV